jgi:hypothetical protein
MSTENEELTGFPYLVKFVEKGVVVLGKIRSGVDVSEDDENYLRAIHKILHCGEYPIFKQKTAINDEFAVQQGLFSEVLSVPAPKDPVHDDFAQ